MRSTKDIVTFLPFLAYRLFAKHRYTCGIPPLYMRNRKLFFHARLRTELFSLYNTRDAMHRELRVVLLKENASSVKSLTLMRLNIFRDIN